MGAEITLALWTLRDKDRVAVYEYRAKVIRVVDGDTLHLDVDLGLDVGVRISVRLAGINAPEMGTPEGLAAKEFVISWFTANIDPAGYVRVRTIKDRREKYGRYLAEIESTVSSASLCTDLLASGNAVMYK